MPFENFYDESDKAARHWRRLVGFGFLALTIYFIAAFWNFVGYKSAQEKLIAESNRVKHVDKLCSELPLPKSFLLVRRDPPIGDEASTLVVYHYHSDRNLEEMMPAYLDLIAKLDKEGWKSTAKSQLVFEKNNQIVVLLGI